MSEHAATPLFYHKVEWLARGHGCASMEGVYWLRAHAVDPLAMLGQGIPAVVFLFRFLQHVLPAGFTRVRYFGFLANSCKTKRLASIHRQRKLKEYTPSPLAGASKMTILKELFQKDFSCCPSCGAKLIQLPRGRPGL